MNTIKTMTENIVNFIMDIADHYGEPISAVEEALSHINFYSLYQTLRRKARPVYTYHAGSGGNGLMEYRSERLFPGDAILLYRDEDFSMDAPEISTAHYLEVWLREDLTIAITSCFRVMLEDVDYPTTYRTYKGTEWPYDEETFEMDLFIHGLLAASPNMVCLDDVPLFEP